MARILLRIEMNVSSHNRVVYEHHNDPPADVYREDKTDELAFMLSDVLRAMDISRPLLVLALAASMTTEHLRQYKSLPNINLAQDALVAAAHDLADAWEERDAAVDKKDRAAEEEADD